MKNGTFRRTTFSYFSIYRSAFSTKGHRANKETEIRSVFANYIVGNIDEKEARALGLVTGNGSVTIPDFLSKEIITYAQEENFLRRLGTGVKQKKILSILF